MPAKSKAAGPPPDESLLRDAAVAHLARYEATRDGLIRVLDRRIARWARRSGEADRDVTEPLRAVARRVADALVASGVVDDARFAGRRAALHARSGRSARSSRALLGVLGVPAALADEVSAREPDLELEAAVAHARKRRLGPFGKPGEDPRDRHRALSSFARAGFSSDIARRVMALPLDAAERLVQRLRERD